MGVQHSNMSKYDGGINKNVVGEGDRLEADQKDYYDKSSHYDTVWGEDNIHLSYYPHLVGPVGGDNLAVLNNKQAADCLTKRMIDVGRINHKTTLLDLGCGNHARARHGVLRRLLHRHPKGGRQQEVLCCLRPSRFLPCAQRASSHHRAVQDRLGPRWSSPCQRLPRM